jgi:hypothetical protein
MAITTYEDDSLHAIHTHALMLIYLDRMSVRDVIGQNASRQSAAGWSGASSTRRKHVRHTLQIARQTARRRAGVRYPAVVLLAVLALCLVFRAGAQSTFGTIRGTVQDSSGAVIPDAAVTVKSQDQGTTRQAISDGAGDFVVENLQPGRYTVTVERAGFSKAVVNGAQLTARQDLRIPVTLSIATEATEVIVEASGAAINTEDATLGDSKDNELITELPLNDRATTTSPLGSLSLSANVQADSSGNIALGGASSSMVNFSVDGISTTNVRQNGALQDAYPSQEGIEAVKITSFNNSAEFSQVGDVTFTTKSGTNKFHGSLFEYLQNDALDAVPYGFSGKAPKHFNTFGGSLGGPVLIPHVLSGRDKTFFFVDYEGNRRATAVAQQFLVPTQDERNGDLTALGGGTIAAGNISPTAKALLAYYPLPNVAGQSNFNYEQFASTPGRTDGADIRMDETITSKQAAYARFSRKNITSDIANNLLPNDADGIHNRSLLVSHTYTLSQHLVNEFRFGFTNVTTAVNFPIAGVDALAQLDLTGVNISQHPLTHAFPTFNFNAGTNFTVIGRDKTGTTQSKTTQFTDNVSYNLGKHNLKAGLDVRRVRYFDLESFAPAYASDDFGAFIFQPTFTGNAFGDFLTGAPTFLNFAVSSPDVGGTAWQYSVYAQDEFQLTSRLTLSYGLRWQVLPSFQEDGGNLANFDQKTNSIVVPDQLAAYLNKNNLQATNLGFQQSFNACNLGNTSMPCTNYVTASQDHLPQGLRNTYMGNFQPRFSLAWRPFNDTKTVVRAGFGVFTITNLGPLSFNNSGNPTSALHTYTNTANSDGSPSIRFPQTAPANVGGPVYGGGGLDQGVDPNYRDPQANQWNLTVERQVGTSNSVRASYVGMHTGRLSITEDINQVPAGTTPYSPAATPYPNWFELFTTFNAGKANYHALELEATHKSGHGLYLDLNYTFAKNLADNQGDTPSSYAGEVNYGLPIADRFHIPADYGNTEGTRRQRFLMTGSYQVPVGKGRAFMNGGGWTDAVLGGWELNTVTLLETGPWLTPNISTGEDQSNTNVGPRGALLRPDQVSNNFSAGRSRAQYFNPAAFAPTPVGAGRFGNAGVGILQGPGTEAVSLGLAKVYRVGERARVRFESTFTNVLNHTNFAPPSILQQGSTGFGALSAAQTSENAGNRTGQAALRVDF